MARVCQVTGKRTITGNNVSHAHNKTKRKFLPNLHNRRFWVESENRWVRLRISTAGLRLIDKKGIDTVLSDQLEELERKEDITAGVMICPNAQYYPISVEKFIASILEDEFRA